MVERKNMTNLEIYNYANTLLQNFQGETSPNIYPVKVYFYLQKNIDTLVNLAKEIEAHRFEIIKKYGEPMEEDPEQYRVLANKLQEANQELEDLTTLTQEVPINMMKLEWFDNVNMSAAQVKAISFMISEE